MTRKLAVIFLTIGLLFPVFGQALGLGNYTLDSYLDQSLKLDIELLQVRDLAAEEIVVSLASEQEFKKSGVERFFFLTDMRMSVEVHGDGTATVHVISRKPIREPFLNFLIEVRWPAGKLVREYTLLLDPPVYAKKVATAISSPEVVIAPEVPANEPVFISDAEEVVPVAVEDSAAVTAVEQHGSLRSDEVEVAPGLAVAVSPSLTPREVALSALNKDEATVSADGNVNDLTAREASSNESVPAGEALNEAATQLSPENGLSASEKAPAPIAIKPEQNQSAESSAQVASIPVAIQPQSKEEATPPAEQQVRVIRSSDTESEVSQESNYRVQRNDTMWSIAKRNSQSSSIHQTMIAIQELNPDAFIDSNINLVKRGQVLRIPTAQQIKSTNSRRAIAKVAEQNRAWKSLLVEKGMNIPGASNAQLDGASKAVKEKPSKGSKPEGSVTLIAGGSSHDVKAGSASGSAGKSNAAEVEGLQNQIAISTEELNATETSNAGLSSHVKELESSVEQSSKILELKSNELASLTAELEKAKITLAADLPVNDDSTNTADGEVRGEDAAPTAKDGVAATVAAKKVKPPAISPPVIEETEESLSDFVISMLPVIALALLLAVALGGGVYYFMQKRNQESAGAVFDEGDFKGTDDDLFAEAGVDVEGFDEEFDADDIPLASDEDFESEVEPEVVHEEVVDPMSEVDIAIAYGRFPQATELLQAAIAGDPGNISYRLKLLSVYVEVNDRASFDAEAVELNSLADADVDAHVEELRAKLGDVPEPIALDEEDLSLDDLEFDLSAELAEDDEDEDKTLIRGEGLSDATAELDALDDLDMFSEPEEPSEDEVLDLSSEFESELEAELEIPTAAPVEEAAVVEVPAIEDVVAEDELELDLDDSDAFSMDLDLSEPEPQSTDTLSELDVGVTGELDALAFDAELELDVDDGAFDLSLDDSVEDLDSSLEELTFDLSESVSDESSESSEIDLSLDELSLDSSSALDVETPADEAPTLIGTPALDAELDIEEPAVDPMTMTAEITAIRPAITDDDDIDLDSMGELDDTDFDFLADADENATKLDLAKAYIDMGDSEGAKDILDEVVSDGSSDQKDEASALLADIA